VPSSNQATTLESQLIQGIQIVFGQTLRTKNALRVYWIVLLGGITALPLILALESANTIGWFGFSPVDRLILYLSGAIGGLASWLVIAGFHVKA
jgi:hypothetical protein